MGEPKIDRPIKLTRRELFKWVGGISLLGGIKLITGAQLSNPEVDKPSTRVYAALNLINYVSGQSQKSEGDESLRYKTAAVWLWAAGVADFGSVAGLNLSSWMMKEYLYSFNSSARNLTDSLIGKLDVKEIIQRPLALLIEDDRMRKRETYVDRLVYKGVKYYTQPHPINPKDWKDLFTALGTSGYELNYQEMNFNRAGNDLSVNIVNPVLTMTDYYDFNGTHNDSRMRPLSMAADALPSGLPGEVRSQLRAIMLEVERRSVYDKLTINDLALPAKAGLATEYPVWARIECPKELHLNLQLNA